MDLINQYVYAVVSKLPEKQREDIGEEIRTLIEDMKEKYIYEKDEVTQIEKIITELGDPSTLAEGYLDQKRYLIGPKIYNQYKLILKIVLLSILIAVTVASLVEGIFISDASYLNFIKSYSSNLTSSIFQGLIWVTIIFAILEYNGVTFDDKKEKWDVSQLQKIPHKKAIISKVGSIVGIVFISIFSMLFYFSPELIGIYFIENSEYTIISVFNLEYFDKIKLLFIGLFLIGITKEVLKIIYGRWTLKLAIYLTLLTIASLALTIIIFTNPQIWNADFNSDLKEFMNLDVNIVFNKLTIIKVILFFSIIEILSVLFKGIKYNDI